MAAVLLTSAAMASAAIASTRSYEPRQAQQTVLHQVVREHLADFIEQAESDDYGLPEFVKGELEAFLACGHLRHGFTHLKCPRCGLDRFLPFSCKSRTICSSCAGRRMNETTAFLVDHVIADVPVRHWALTFPSPLRYLLAYDSELCTRAINIFVHAVFDWQRRVAKRELGLASVTQATPAAITAIHRVGSALNLNLHLHSAVADGVFVQTSANERPVFRALPAPERIDITALAWDICQKTTHMLQKLGRYLDADPAEADKLAQESPLLAACYAASLQGSVAVGDRAGQRVQRDGQLVEHGESDNVEQVRTLGHGFNLDTGMRAAAHDTKARERILRYILRPPIATKRLTRGEDGRVSYWLKNAWADGSKCVIFEPIDFIAKLLPLIPPPRANLIRYHGAWAPHAAIRKLVVPSVDGAGQGQLTLPLGSRATQAPLSASAADGARGAGDTKAACHPRVRHERISWSELAKRTFEIDVTQCARCGHSPILVVAVVAVPSREQLSALRAGGNVIPLRPERSRAPPRGQLSFAFA